MRIGLTRRLMVLCGVMALLPGTMALAAVDAYMTIEGSVQGPIKGDSTRAGVAGGSIPLTSVTHEVTAPRDAATGMASGKRQYSAITITKSTDASSPNLARAMETKESLRQVTIVFAGAGADKEKAAQKIVLNDAVISSIQRTGETETIKFVYQKIEVTYMNGSKSAQDAWDAR